MLPDLNPIEARVIGCLIEKSVTTPDQYPLTLNALVNACNQKSGRDPVMALQPGEVQHAARDLERNHLVRSEENFKSRVEKYTQRMCNTQFSDYKFNSAQLSIVCLLLLRGPQTPGELRARSGRLHTFEDNAAVITAAESLIDREGEPMLIKLPRTAGRKDAEYMHLFSGPVDIEAHRKNAEETQAKSAAPRVSTSDLHDRVTTLEAQVAELKSQIAALQ